MSRQFSLRGNQDTQDTQDTQNMSHPLAELGVSEPLVMLGADGEKKKKRKRK